MNFFIDTSTNKIILALINDNKKVVEFEVHNSNRDMVKNTNYYLDLLLKKHNISYLDIKKIYFTIGPGSFTGLKVSYLISKFYFLSNENIKLYTISSLELFKTKNNNPVIQIAKHNFYYYKKNLFWNNKIVFAKELPTFKNIVINFDNFNLELLENSLVKFKEQSIFDIKLIYMNEFN